jgi:hypothetical protein
MDGACDTCGVKVRIGFWWENLRERNYLEDLGVEGKMDNQKVDGDLDWIHLALDNDCWRVLVNAVICWESLDYKRTCQLLKKISVPCT